MKYSGLFLDNSFFLDISVSRHSQEYDEKPGNGDYDTMLEVYRWHDPEAHGDTNPLHTDGYRDGGIGLYQNTNSTRDAFDLRTTYFLGTHELKIGYQYESTEFDTEQRYTGTMYVRYFDTYYRTRMRTLDGVAETINSAIYLQDSWQITPHLFVNVGARFEKQTIRRPL